MISGFIANLVSSIALGPNIVSVGASAAIFGLLGYLMNLQKQMNIISLKKSLAFLLIYFLFSSGTGGGSLSVNLLAHFIGLLTGWVLASKYFTYNKLKEERLQMSKVKMHGRDSLRKR